MARFIDDILLAFLNHLMISNPWRQAQHLKYQNILDLLNLEPGASILEIGLWLGRIHGVCSSKGYKVKGITISPSQFKFAKQRIQSLSGYCAIELIDYRNITGSYDAVVSIEMFEL